MRQLCQNEVNDVHGAFFVATLGSVIAGAHEANYERTLQVSAVVDGFIGMGHASTAQFEDLASAFFGGLCLGVIEGAAGYALGGYISRAQS